MKTRTYNISVSFERHHSSTMVKYSRPMRFALTRRGLNINHTFKNRMCKAILREWCQEEQLK